MLTAKKTRFLLYFLGAVVWLCAFMFTAAAQLPILSVSPQSVNEGNSGITNAVVTVNLSASSTQTVTVSYRLVAVSATPDVDYQNVTGGLTFSPGQTARTLNVPIIGDTLDEDDEYLFVQLFNAVNAGIMVSSNPPLLTIVDDDDGPVLNVGDVSVTEGNAGTTTANVTVSLGVAGTDTITIACATANSRAIAPADYLAFNQTLTFNPGEINKTIALTINGDTAPELDERFFLNLTPLSGTLRVNDNQAAITIVNDEVLPNNSVHLESAGIVGSETARQVPFTVRRLGDTAGISSIDYATSDGTALQRTDYTLNTGTLRFAAGESSKVVMLILTDDNYDEDDETFTFVLINPAGTYIGPALSNIEPETRPYGTGVARIFDDDTGTPIANPLETAGFFVRQHYADFLSRAPDDAGLAYWQGQITDCGMDAACVRSRRIGVSAAFFVELEFQETGAFVYRLYKAAFGETAAYRPAYDGFMPDRSRVVGGATLAQGRLDFATLFVNRPEFLTRYPANLTAAQLVDAVLQTVQQGSGVTFTMAQRDAFIANVNTGGRGLFLRNLGDNAAFNQAVYNRAFVLMQYFGYLRRDPDQAGYDFWVDVITNREPGNFRGMVCAFVTAAEYQQRFSPVTPRSNTECAPGV